MSLDLPFRDRRDAGRLLARELGATIGTGALVLGLPRGGVPVAAEVALALDAELDIFLVRKLGTPGQEELAFGAVASGGLRVINHDIVAYASIPQDVVEAVTQRERDELRRREALYRGARPQLEVRGRSVILVDDGLATGATMLAAVRALRPCAAARLTVAVPVGSAEACRLFAHEADEIVCAATPEPFRAVGLWYEDFTPTSDEEVIALLERPAATTIKPRVPE